MSNRPQSADAFTNAVINAYHKGGTVEVLAMVRVRDDETRDRWGAALGKALGERDAALARVEELAQDIAWHKEQLTRLDAAEAGLERWRHGQQIEGDYVCPNALAATNAEAENQRLRNLIGCAEFDLLGYAQSGKDHRHSLRMVAETLHKGLAAQPPPASTPPPPVSATAESQAARPTSLGSPGDAVNGGPGANPAGGVEPVECAKCAEFCFAYLASPCEECPCGESERGACPACPDCNGTGVGVEPAKHSELCASVVRGDSDCDCNGSGVV